MSRLKLSVLVAAIAALALAASAASAQAHEYKVNGAPVAEGKHWTFLHLSFLTGHFKLLGTPFGVATHIECLHILILGGILFGGKGESELSFKNCTATKPANCAVEEPIITKVTTQLVGPSPGVEVEFKPEVGETFTTIKLTGATCSLKEAFSVTGTQTCKLPKGEEELVAHEIECTTAGSKLKAGGKAATFEGTVKGLELDRLAGEETAPKWASL